MKNLLIITALMTLTPLMANATCYGGCNHIGPQGPQGEQGLPGLNGIDGLDGINGLNGIDGVDGLNGRDGRNGARGLNGREAMTGLSLVAAATSFKGRGIGVGVSGGDGQFEFSLAGGVMLRDNVKGILGITHDKWGRTRGTAGLGFSF